MKFNFSFWWVFLLLGCSEIASATDSIKEEELLQSIEQVNQRSGTFLRALIIESVQEIRRDTKNKESTDWRKASVVSSLIVEAEKDVVLNKLAALDKIAVAVDAANLWRNSFNHWNVSVLRNEGRGLMMRWLVSERAEDMIQANQKYADSEKSEENPKDNGFATYAHGADFRLLADIARELNYSRDRQISLLKAGIEISKNGRKKYPNQTAFESSIDESYGKFEFVSGGSVLGEFIDEWVAYVATQPKETQWRSGRDIAETLFKLDRDKEGLVWANRYIEGYVVWVKQVTIPVLRARIKEDTCSSLGSFWLIGLKARRPAIFAELSQKYCVGVAEAVK